MSSERIFDSIRDHQGDASLSLFSAAGIIGIALQLMQPADAGAEMMLLARNIAHHGTFANPFSSLPTGPTAVNPPLYPFMVAAFMRLLPWESAAFLAAVLGSILANAVTAALLPRVSKVFFSDVIPGVIASILWLAVMPAMPGWYTSYTVVGLLVLCLFTSSSIVTVNSGRSSMVAGSVCGLLFLLNPSSLLVVLPWIGFLLWRGKGNWRRSARYCGITLAALIVFIAAWGEGTITNWGLL